MADASRLVFGTSKGLFAYTASGAGWSLAAPQLSGWEVSTVHADATHSLAATVHWSYGATIRETRDGGQTWTQLEGRPAYGEGSPHKLKRIWQIVPGQKPGEFYAGIDEAGLFVSRDGAKTWREVEGLSAYPTRKLWSPGGGGLCLHTIIVDPTNDRRMWVAVSAVGCFRTDDGGATWQQKTAGLPSNSASTDEPCPMYCVHRIVQHPTKPDTLFMQFHGGVFKSTDAGDNWQKIETGLPSNFGFPMVMTKSGTLILAPLQSDEQRVFEGGRYAIYRSSDEGATWKPTSAGFPDEPTFTGVLRDAMCIDDNGGVYFGTTCGQVFASPDDGATWKKLPGTLPRVMSVRVH
jgi:photosystem II stability/assembly factor-like uncharacterized protein